MQMEAAMSETLLMDVLLGKDAPALPELLHQGSSADAMALMMCSQATGAQ